MNLLPFFPFTVKLLERSKGYPLVFQINFKGKALQQKSIRRPNGFRWQSHTKLIISIEININLYTLWVCF